MSQPTKLPVRTIRFRKVGSIKELENRIVAENVLLNDVGIILLELGFIVTVSLVVVLILKRFGIPAVLGLILGGLLIGVANGFHSYIFQSNFTILKTVVTELALAYIGFDIGREINLTLLRKKGDKLGAVLVGQALGAFLIAGLGVLVLTQNVGVALVLGAIAITTAPAATTMIISEFKAEGELSQTVLFIIAFDDVLAILAVNLALTFALSSGTGVVGLAIVAVLHLLEEVLVSLVFAGIAALLFYQAMKRGLFQNRNHGVEALLATSIILTGAALLFGGSVLLAMFLFGMMLKTLSDHETMDDYMERVEILVMPIVLLFFVLVGLNMDLGLVFAEGGYVFVVALVYFLLRVIGKTFGTWVTAWGLPPTVRANLPFTLITQAGVAVGLASLAFNRFMEAGLATEAMLILNVVGVSVILAELVGPMLIKRALFQSGEARVGGVTGTIAE